MTLFELSQEWSAVYDLLSDPDVPDDAVFDMIDGIEMLLDEKADCYGKIIRNLELDAVALDAEIKRMQTRKAALCKRHDRLKSCLMESMLSTGRKSIKTALFNFAIQRNGGKKPIDIMGQVPTQWLKPGDPDMKKIRDFLEAGNQLPFATLSDPGESLRIR